nr:MAG TPA_asm: hypothetical protein [Caudoviricetes sp.]
MEGEKAFAQKGRPQNKISSGAKRHIGEGHVAGRRQVASKLVGEGWSKGGLVMRCGQNLRFSRKGS